MSAIENIKIVAGNAPATVSADTNCTSVDRRGFKRVLCCVYFGVDSALDSNNHWACHIEDSSDNSSFEDAATTEVYNGTAGGTQANTFGVVNHTDDDAALYVLEYTGSERYCRVVLDETGTLSGPIAVFYVLSEPHVTPVGNSVSQS